MDLTDAGQRIFKRNWALILLLTLIGVAAAFAVVQLRGDSYVGTARIDLGADSTGGQESAALGDTALGLATSPQVLSKAIDETKVARTVHGLIEDQAVQVTPVGTGGVLDVSVTDSNARAAAALANSVATQIVQLRDQARFGATQDMLNQLQQQSDALTAQINDVVNQQRRFLYQVPALQAQQAALIAQRAAVDQQRQGIAESLATAARPRVIDASQTVGTKVSDSMWVFLALGALIGLVLGICLAATREAVTPSLTREALGRHLRAPVLGRLPRGSGGGSPVHPWVANYVGIAARMAGVRTVQLVPVGRRPADVTGLAQSLDAALDDIHVVPFPLAGSRSAGTHEVGQPTPLNPADAGIVVVAPKVVRKKRLVDLERHLAVTKQTVLGVISYRGRLAGAAAEAEPEPVMPAQADGHIHDGHPETVRQPLPSAPAGI